MKAIKIFLAVTALAIVGNVSAATIASYNVTYTNPAFPAGYPYTESGGGKGTASLSDTGVLTLNLHGESISGTGGGQYIDIITDTLVHLNTTSAGSGLYTPIATGSDILNTSCQKGAKDTSNLCSSVALYTDFSGPYIDSAYTNQTFSASNGGEIVFNSVMQLQLPVYYDVTLKPVPLPATAWMFGSGILGLAGFSRRRATAK